MLQVAPCQGEHGVTTLGRFGTQFGAFVLTPSEDVRLNLTRSEPFLRSIHFAVNLVSVNPSSDHLHPKFQGRIFS
jgi:hypothetical protein